MLNNRLIKTHNEKGVIKLKNGNGNINGSSNQTFSKYTRINRNPKKTTKTSQLKLKTSTELNPKTTYSESLQFQGEGGKLSKKNGSNCIMGNALLLNKSELKDSFVNITTIPNSNTNKNSSPYQHSANKPALYSFEKLDTIDKLVERANNIDQISQPEHEFFNKDKYALQDSLKQLGAKEHRYSRNQLPPVAQTDVLPILNHTLSSNALFLSFYHWIFLCRKSE